MIIIIIYLPRICSDFLLLYSLKKNAFILIMKKRVVKKRIDINHICSFNENIPEKGNLYLGSVGILNNVDDLK